MQKIHEEQIVTDTAGPALRKANEAGRLGLILYTIPHFPDPRTYGKINACLSEYTPLSVLETTCPVTDRFSQYANAFIRQSHQIAASHGTGLDCLDHLTSFPKPVILVLYRATFEEHGFDSLLDSSKHVIDGLLFEWDIDVTQAQTNAARRRRTELIQCAGNWMSKDDMEKTLAMTGENPLVYLVSASSTGAELYDPGQLAGIVAMIREIKPDAVIAAGFGIAGPEHIESLKTIPGLNGVIIGTAFLKQMSQGFDAARTYLDSLEPALRL